MILSDEHIRQALEAGLLKIEPRLDTSIKGASYDFHLSQHFLLFDPREALVIDPIVDQRDLMREVEVDREGYFILHPGEFVLASSVECFTFTPYLAGRLEGKSSVARFGLIIHAAGFFDPGFNGHATLELFNPTNLPIKLYPGMVIGQMSFFRMDGEVKAPYGPKAGSKYQDADAKPAASRYFENYSNGYTPSLDLDTLLWPGPTVDSKPIEYADVKEDGWAKPTSP